MVIRFRIGREEIGKDYTRLYIVDDNGSDVGFLDLTKEDSAKSVVNALTGLKKPVITITDDEEQKQETVTLDLDESLDVDRPEDVDELGASDDSASESSDADDSGDADSGDSGDSGDSE